MTRLRIDLHTHTNHSWDGWMSPAELVRRSREVGLDRVAVTDHNEIEGALRARDLDPERIIVGEEVRCADGCEVIGLFLERRIPPRLPLEKAVDRIREQGGLVYAPHPYAYLRYARRRATALLAVADVVEVFNGRAFWPSWNARAAREAESRGLRAAASSDAHLPSDSGLAWTEVDSFASAEELLQAMHGAVLVKRSTVNPLAHVLTFSNGMRRLALHHLPRPWTAGAARLDEA